jgi:hypothetical protein
MATTTTQPQVATYTTAPTVISAASGASYSSQLFNTTWEPVRNAQGQSAYDMQRQQLEAASQRNQELRRDALQRQFGIQGIADSGINLKQQRIAATEGQQALMGGMQNIGIAELGEAEKARQAALQRLYGAEAQGQQLSSSERIAQAGIASSEKVNQNKDWLAQQGIDLQSASLYGFTDANGNHVDGTADIASKTLGLQSRTLEDQEKELFGYMGTDSSGNITYIPGKMNAMNGSDRRAADELYGYWDENLGMHIPGTLELQKDSNDIQRQGMTLEEARIKGYDRTNPDGSITHVMGTNEIAAYEVDQRKDIELLRQNFETGLLAKQQIIDASKLLTAQRSARYYSMGKNGTPIDPSELQTIQLNDPLAYESYLAGKEGKSESEIADLVKTTQAYRESVLANIDDKDTVRMINAFYSDMMKDPTFHLFNPVISTYDPDQQERYSNVLEVLGMKPKNLGEVY